MVNVLDALENMKTGTATPEEQRAVCLFIDKTLCPQAFGATYFGDQKEEELGNNKTLPLSPRNLYFNNQKEEEQKNHWFYYGPPPSPPPPIRQIRTDGCKPEPAKPEPPPPRMIRESDDKPKEEPKITAYTVDDEAIDYNKVLDRWGDQYSKPLSTKALCWVLFLVLGILTVLFTMAFFAVG